VTDRPLSATRADLHHIRVRFATFRDLTIDERSAHAAQLSSVPVIERFLLDTCHRVELVSVDDAPTAGRCVAGREAIRRVFEVVGGFDSAVIAEEQLLGQVRAAYEAALADGSTGPILNELLRRALRFGRRVRTHARPGTDRSLADRGASWLLERLGADPAAVLVAGTGEMGRLAALRLAGAGHRVTIISRSPERGRRVLERLVGSQHRLVVGSLEPATVAGSRAVVLAVRSREPILSALQLQAGAPPWTIDLSTPAAVSADAAALLGKRLLTLDRLGEISGAAPVLATGVERRLRAEMDDEVERFAAWLDARRSGDALAVLHGEADAVRRRHLDRLSRSAGLGPGQLAAVEAASAAMMGELLHGPSVELRRGGADAETVRRIFGLEA
jgi:glutamyl-tRNA reductase